MAYQIGDKYYHNDIESGRAVEISKATFDAMNETMKNFHDKLKELRKDKGNIIILSTTAIDDVNISEDYKNLWNDFNDNTPTPIK